MPERVSSAVGRYLAQLPAARRKEIEQVRSVVCKHLPAGYEETVTKGMVVYQVPLRRYPETYNGHPLWYVALAAQARYLTLHLMPVYGSARLADKLRDGFASAGKKLNMGKACIRFQVANDLALDTIGEIVASIPVDDWVALAQRAQRRRR